MGFFSNTLEAIGDLFDDAGAAVGDVVEDVGDVLLGPSGQRGERIGTAVGGYFGGSTGAAIGGTIGAGLSADIAAAPDVERERRRARQSDDETITTPYVRPQITSVPDRPVTQQDYMNMARGREIYTGGFSRADEGTVIDIRYPKTIEAIGTGMDILGDIYDYFVDGDDAPATGQMMMCPTNNQPKAFNVNRNTGCITITRKQQAKLKEAVRMFGGAAVAKNLRISPQTLQNLLLKTFRPRRRGISGADIRAVKRVDRQMHSLACALGGISSTSKAVGARKSPPARKC